MYSPTSDGANAGPAVPTGTAARADPTVNDDEQPWERGIRHQRAGRAPRREHGVGVQDEEGRRDEVGDPARTSDEDVVRGGALARVTCWI